MGNVNMEADQIHVRDNNHKTWRTVADALKALETSGESVAEDITELYTRDASRASKDDIANEFSAEQAYYTGDFVYYQGSLFKFIADHSAGAWNPEEVAPEQIGPDIVTLKSGLNNVTNAVKLNTNDLTTRSRTKNLLSMTLDGIKTINQLGTWSGNVYTYKGVTFTATLDSDGNITGITADGTATNGNAVLYLLNKPDIEADTTYIMNGCPSGGGDSTYNIQYSNFVNTVFQDNGSGINITKFDYITYPNSAVVIRIMNGYNVQNKTFLSMIRLATETDATYSPYIPSVDSRLDAVEEIAADIADQLPTAPTTDGAYVLTVTVADGTPTYSWKSAT